MEDKKEYYPEGTMKQTDNFKERQDKAKIVAEVVEKILIDETKKAFKKYGVDEKEGHYSVIAADYDDASKQKEIGKGVQAGKINVTLAKAKMSNPAAIKPVSFYEKTIMYGTKRLRSDIQLQIVDDALTINYKNSEAGAFQSKSNGPTYTKDKLNAKITIGKISGSKEFKKELQDFFQEICHKNVTGLCQTRGGRWLPPFRLPEGQKILKFEQKLAKNSPLATVSL